MTKALSCKRERCQHSVRGDSKAGKKGKNMLVKTEMVVKGHKFVRSNVSVKARASYLVRTLDMTWGRSSRNWHARAVYCRLR